MIFFNFFECDIAYDGRNFRSVEHAYQYTQAMTLGYQETAQDILNTDTGRDAKMVSKELPQSNAWDLVKLDVMRDLVKIKMDTCMMFTEALIETGDKILAEATSDCFYGSGLSPELTKCTRPANFPGHNELGKLMMELRSAHQLFHDIVLPAKDGSKTPASPNYSVFVQSLSTPPHSAKELNQETYDSYKKEMEAIEQEIRAARDLTRTTSACRSSSGPARKSPKNVPSDAAKTGIKKYLTSKRQASSSPVKDDIQFKEKQATLLPNTK